MGDMVCFSMELVWGEVQIFPEERLRIVTSEGR